MARLVYALNVSLDGYVDHDRFAPDPVLFRHFIEDIGAMAAVVYGRRMYELMRYWDDEQPGWGDAEREYAAAWRSRHKWVGSRTLTSVGPNATLISDGVEAAVRRLKTELDGEIEVAGPVLAGGLTGLIDEYRLYLHPVVLGSGAPFFTGPRPRLRLVGDERIGADVIRLSYVPA
ncbi:dihydrofolate reductase family protein [Caulobacter sp. 17J65-9]|uniref:dihydrofolate reductase family protein n=1 Tax=Caulobacter sp. 17J65-9 TaxID=2709382 RepID=UPI0013CD866C|nr:dihydrofolate reductase family protein [Caulobacter sp. 17J65-9]NEX93821.1 dihydrofolate reductase [Caulobacter sp. 17J65-9]